MKIIPATAIALLSSTALLNSPTFAQQTQQNAATAQECAQLVQFLERREEADTKTLPITLEQARKH